MVQEPRPVSGTRAITPGAAGQVAPPNTRTSVTAEAKLTQTNEFTQAGSSPTRPAGREG